MVRVYVGEQVYAEVCEAVRRGGGVLSDPEDAEVMVWMEGPSPRFTTLLGPQVRWVQLRSAGIDSWLTSGLLDPSLTWSNATGCYARPVAEHALALMLGTARRLHTVARASRWQPEEKFAGATLESATVMVVGAGGIGRRLIEMVRVLGARSIAVTRSGRDVADADVSCGVDDWQDHLGACDYLVLALPKSPSSVGMVNREVLGRLPDHAWIVNVGRGETLVTDDLVAALEDGTVGGAALDVTDPEPLPDEHPLWRFPDVVVTPHAAVPLASMLTSFGRRVEDNLIRYRHGQPLIGAFRSTDPY